VASELSAKDFLESMPKRFSPFQKILLTDLMDDGQGTGSNIVVDGASRIMARYRRDSRNAHVLKYVCPMEQLCLLATDCNCQPPAIGSPHYAKRLRNFKTEFIKTSDTFMRWTCKAFCLDALSLTEVRLALMVFQKYCFRPVKNYVHGLHEVHQKQFSFDNFNALVKKHMFNYIKKQDHKSRLFNEVDKLNTMSEDFVAMDKVELFIKKIHRDNPVVLDRLEAISQVPEDVIEQSAFYAEKVIQGEEVNRYLRRQIEEVSGLISGEKNSEAEARRLRL